MKKLLLTAATALLASSAWAAAPAIDPVDAAEVRRIAYPSLANKSGSDHLVDAVLQTMDRGHLKKNPKDEETDSSFNITDLLDSLSLAELTKFTREVLPMYYYQVQNRTLPVKYMTKI